MKRTYDCWVNMKQRCDNPRHPSYSYYGGRGITYCEQWGIYINFLNDMGEAPEELTLERRDNEKGYEKDNCYWATRAEQANNRRSPRTYKSSTSGHAGISWNKQKNRWWLRIRRKHIGFYATLEEAISAKEEAGT